MTKPRRTVREKRETHAKMDVSDMVLAIEWLLTQAWHRGYRAARRKRRNHA